MRQFDLYENPAMPMRMGAPFVVVLSSHLLGDLIEAVVAPVRRGASAGVPGLEVPVVIDGEALLVSVSGIAGIRAEALRRRIGSLLAQEDEIRRALDRLFTGF
ncbi:MAG: CcdB family protein [bacterium]|nr:CcdB family protein [bacterium]